MKHQLITISGQLGSGKSTIAKMLAKQLNYQYYSTGMAQRAIAEKRGITTLELNKLSENDPSIDKEIDGIYQNPPWGDLPCIIDSRLAFHFIPQSFKICLKVDSKEAAKRVFNANREHEKYSTEAEAESYLNERAKLEKERFIKIYQVDITKDNLFDLVLDTTNMSPEQICDQIMKNL